MDSAELQKLAVSSRSTREAGIALLFASAILGFFLLLPPVSGKPAETTAAAVATSTAPDAFAQVATEAEAAIIFDLATGETLYAKNADAQLPLASLTKLLTVYAALEELPSDASIVIPEGVKQLEAPRAFSVGQRFSLSDLARLTLTASLNDGATAIASAAALHRGESESRTLAAAAASLSLSQTYAVNGSGLDMSTAVSGGYGSARDLALLAGALAARSPDIARATTESTAQAVSEGGTHFSVKNTDPMIGVIPRLLLSKTGYTDLAGGNLALVFDAGIEHPIAIVVLGSSKSARFTDGTRLVAATLAHFAGVSSL